MSKDKELELLEKFQTFFNSSQYKARISIDDILSFLNKLHTGNIKHKFSDGEKVIVNVSKFDRIHHTKRKGSVGTIIKSEIRLNKPCYWIMFADGFEEYFEEWELKIYK